LDKGFCETEFFRNGLQIYNNFLKRNLFLFELCTYKNGEDS